MNVQPDEARRVATMIATGDVKQARKELEAALLPGCAVADFLAAVETDEERRMATALAVFWLCT